MQLTSHTDYALRVLVYLLLHEGEQVSVRHMAKVYGVSVNHLSKVAAELVRLGWVKSRRGNGGGLRLLPDTKELSVGDVVRELEHNMRLVECFGPQNRCPLAPACALKSALYEAAQAFLSVLDGYSLKSLVHNPETLRTLLS